ncbi:hypothetical protein QVD17_27236 [Tagetes erecta]|uniref:Uncharacterized protein n=1 Tax=Tagetes erecta TaxID=13708 RepID=A0AAD8NR30_TARER|nr:hypothetical protein QVD17_27236 [Tagetes erecta]
MSKKQVNYCTFGINGSQLKWSFLLTFMVLFQFFWLIIASREVAKTEKRKSLVVKNEVSLNLPQTHKNATKSLLPLSTRFDRE